MKKQNSQFKGKARNNKGTSGQYTGGRRTHMKQLIDEAREENLATMSKGNDPTWNILPDVAASDVASIAFGQNPALPFTVGNEFNPAVDFHPTFGSNTSTIIPGAMSLNFTPTYGRSVSETSALNISAQEFYAAIRSKNSGARNYERADLFMYVAAMDSASMLYALGMRAYAATRTATNKNWYWPRSIVGAMGFDYDDLIANAAKLRYGINLFAKKMSQFTMPWNFDVYKRHAMLCGSVFTDKDSAKGQVYLFKPTGYYRFKPTKYKTGGCLEWTNMLTGALTVDLYLTLLNDVADSLTKIEDIGIMSGDIQKAFPDTPQLQWVVLDENVELAVQNLDHRMLAQIHNAVAVGSVNTDGQEAVTDMPQIGTPDIYQQNGFIYSDPRFNAFPQPASTKHATADATIVDANDDWDRTPEGVLYLTKLAVTGVSEKITVHKSGSDITEYPMKLDNFSTEVINSFEIWGLDESTAAPKKGLNSIVLTTYNGIVAANNPTVQRVEVYRLLTYVGALSTFDWAPRVVFTDAASTQDIMYNYPMIWETCDQVVVKRDVLSRIHDYTSMAAMLRRG